MTRMTASFTVEASVDTARRRIVGLVVPFGEVGHAALAGEPARLVFEAGSLTWDDPNQVKLVVDHNGDRPVFAGKARDLVQTEQGIVGTFAVSQTTAGNDLLVEAADGLRTGLSVEADLPDSIEQVDGVWTVTAANPGRLNRVAFVERPAFPTAQVHEVAAAEVADDTLTAAVDALRGVVEQLTPSLPTDPGGDNPKDEEPMSDTSSTAAEQVVTHVTAAATPPLSTAVTAVTREPFPYGHAGASGLSLFADMLNSRHDDAAASRVRQAEAMLKVTAADEAIVKTDVTIPNVYSDALTVQQISFPRDIADNVPRTAISNSQVIYIPQVQGVTADGGSGQVVSAHVENTNPAAGEVDIDYITASPALYSGKFDISREALDAGSPGMDAMLLGFLRESYNVVTDTAAYTAIAGAGGIDTGTSTTDADLQVEARNMEKTLRQEMGAFKGRRGAPANIIWSNSTIYSGLVGYDASDGRPILPYLAPSNTSGQAPAGNYDGLALQGVPLVNATNVASAKVLLARKEDIHVWESPSLTFRWDEVAGPAKVRFVLAGYFVAAVLQPAGVCLITQS